MFYDLRKARIVQIFSIENSMIVELADEKDVRWVIEMRDVIGFGYHGGADAPVAVHIDDLDSPPGAYAVSLSARLQRPEIRNYPAVYLMREPICNEVVFSAVAQFTHWKRAESR